MSWNRFLDRDRNRVGWWLYVLALGIGVAFVGYSFVGTFVFGVFLYYAARPIDDRVNSYVERDGWAAGVTLAGIVTPILLVITYVVVTSLQDLALLSGTGGPLDFLVNGDNLTRSQQEFLNRLVNDPTAVLSNRTGQVRELLTSALSVLGTLFVGFLHLTLSFTIAFFLLRDDDHIADWFREEVAPEGTTGHAYAVAVDDELETVFFGNVVFVFVMAAIATVVYYGFNLVAPSGLTIPYAILLALLTGVTSLVPIVVGKIVYVPLVAYLAWIATQQGGSTLVYPVGLLVVSFLFLDILPQTFLQPYITGRQIHFGIMMFGYILGPMLFGWYGFFLLPLFLVLVIQALRIVVTDMIHGDRLTPTVDAAPTLGPRPYGTIEDEGDEEAGPDEEGDPDEEDDGSAATSS